MKKYFIISIFLIMTIVSGCSSKTSADDGKCDSDYDDHLDISIAYWNLDTAIDRSKEDAVLDYIENKFNVTFVPENITWDDYYNKINLLAKTDSLPDLFVGAYREGTKLYDWVDHGIIKEIPSDLSKYKNLEQYMDSPEKDSCMVDGKTFCIFRQTYREQAETIKDRAILYRWDLARKAGITEEPRTWEEFDNMIQAIIKADPDNNGISGLTSKGFSMIVGPLLTYSVPLASTGGSSFYWVKEGSVYVPAIFAGESFGEDALATWELVRDMYADGTIEEDILLTSTSQAEEKFLSGKSAAICIDAGVSNKKTYENLAIYWKDLYGNDFLDDVKILDMMPSVDGNKYYTVWDYAWSESYINSKVSDEKLDRILAIYDYLLSPEGVLLSNYGIEGESYSIDESGKVELLTNELPTTLYPSIELFAYLVSWNFGNIDESNYPNVVPEEYIEADEERVEEARKCKLPEYDYECSRIFSQLGTDFTIDINDIFKEIINDTRPLDETWTSIIDEYKARGIDEIIEKVNEERNK